MLRAAVRRPTATARAMRTCSRARKGPVSPVPTATLPSIAASTTSRGSRDDRRIRAARAESAPSAISTGRAPYRSAGRRTSHVSAALPTVRARLDEAELSLAAVRAALIEGYGRWRRALEDVENLWALAAWRSTAAEEPAEKAAALAA